METFEIIIFLVKYIFSFDTDYLFKNKMKGGGENDGESDENTINTLEMTEKAEAYAGQMEIQKYIDYAIECIKKWANDAKDIVVLWIIIPFLFAAVSPAIPLIGVMSVMAALMKYIMWHFRKL